jgi:uncharacterized protein
MRREGKSLMRAKTRRTLLLVSILIIGLSVYFFWGNNYIVISEADFANSKIPASFDGFTIAQVSDLHNKNFGENQEGLLAKMKAVDPDIIVITGDLIDRRKYNLSAALDFVEGAAKIASVYYVTGNHEAWLDEFEEARKGLTEAGAIFMDDSEATLTKDDSMIKILGVSDPDFLTTEYAEGNDVSKMTRQLAEWSSDETFKILLTHRPELFELYVDNKMDLIFAGHTHGGQIRIPFVGGVVAPDQGWFPKYSSGKYAYSTSTMFVSRGLGNSLFPLRINDNPEIVVVRLKNEEIH